MEDSATGKLLGVNSDINFLLPFFPTLLFFVAEFSCCPIFRQPNLLLPLFPLPCLWLLFLPFSQEILAKLHKIYDIFPRCAKLQVSEASLANACRDARTADALTPVIDAPVTDTRTAVQRIRHASWTTREIKLRDTFTLEVPRWLYDYLQLGVFIIH